MPIDREKAIELARSRGLLTESQPTPRQQEAMGILKKRGLVEPDTPTDDTSGFLSEVKAGVIENIPEIVGSIALPTAAAIGTGGLSLPASAGLAGLGGAAGRAFKQLGKRAMGREDVPQTSAEAAKSIGTEALVSAAGEGVGRVAMAGLGKAVAPFSKRMEPVVMKIKDTFKDVGGLFTPAQMTDTAILDIAENMAEGSFTGGGKLRAFKLAQQEAVKELEGNVSEMFARESSEKLSDEAIGELFLNVARKGRSVHAAASKELYKNVDSLARDAIVDFSPVSKVADDVLKRIDIEGTSELKRLLNTVKEVGVDGKNIGFSEAHSIRSAILTKARDLVEVPGEDTTVRTLKMLAANIDNAMESAAKELPTDAALKSWRAANKFFKEGKEAFDNDFMAKMIIANKKAPERIGESIFKRGNIEEVKVARKALRKAAELDPSINYDDTWKAMQSGLYEDIISRSVDPETGEIVGRKLLRFLGDRRLQRTMNVAFSKEQRSAIRELAETAATTQRKPKGGAGMVMQIAQGGAIVGFVGGIVTGKPDMRDASAGIFIAPWVLSRLLTNPSAIKWLSTGFKINKFGDAAIRALSQLSAQSVQEIKEASGLNEVE